jgi:hypothetical protein
LEPWLYPGDESIVSVPVNVVDWVLIELRDAQDVASAGQSARVARQAGFIMNNGAVKSIDGINNPQFNVSINHQLFVVIYHRNHLPVISNYPLTESGGKYVYDFANAGDKAYGGTLAQKELAAGVWGMISGDSDASGWVDNLDKTVNWETEAGTSGYLNTDLNLDTQSNNIDKNKFWLLNLGASSQLPE